MDVLLVWPKRVLHSRCVSQTSLHRSTSLLSSLHRNMSLLSDQIKSYAPAPCRTIIFAVLPCLTVFQVPLLTLHFPLTVLFFPASLTPSFIFLLLSVHVLHCSKSSSSSCNIRAFPLLCTHAVSVSCRAGLVLLPLLPAPRCLLVPTVHPVAQCHCPR